MPMPNLLKLGIVVAMLCTALAACHTRHKSACHIRQSHLREGDVIFRRGTSANSRMVTLLQGFYSHVGIVADSSGHGDLRIVHAVPDEPDFKGDYDRVKMDRLDTFLSPQRAEAACLMRQDDAEVAHKAASHALRLLKKAYALTLIITNKTQPKCIAQNLWHTFINKQAWTLQGMSEKIFKRPGSKQDA